MTLVFLLETMWRFALLAVPNAGDVILLGDS